MSKYKSLRYNCRSAKSNKEAKMKGGNISEPVLKDLHVLRAGTLVYPEYRQGGSLLPGYGPKVPQSHGIKSWVAAE